MRVTVTLTTNAVMAEILHDVADPGRLTATIRRNATVGRRCLQRAQANTVAGPISGLPAPPLRGAAAKTDTTALRAPRPTARGRPVRPSAST